MKVEKLRFARTIGATPSLVFRAWSRASALREWLCDGATIEPRVQGRYVLWWNDGYLTAGAVQGFEVDRRLAFGWAGGTDPEPTHVEVSLTPESNGVHVKVEHGGLKSGRAWDTFREEIARGWESGLENLQSVLEEGDDLRVLRRPMIGIVVGEYTPEIAARLGIAEVAGVRLDGTIHGMGAEAAGLRKDDVIAGIDGRLLEGWPSIGAVLSRRRPGETVIVQVYRDGALLEVPLLLSLRSMAPVPEELAEFVRRLRLMYDDAFSKVSEQFAGASAAAARARPEPGSWSALETVAHLIDTEREVQATLIDAIRDDERVGDGGANPTNVDVHVSALAAVHNRSTSMLAALRASYDETIVMVERLPDSLLLRRATYRRLARNMLELANHTDSHVAQIREALIAAEASGAARQRAHGAGGNRDSTAHGSPESLPSSGPSRLRFVGGL